MDGVSPSWFGLRPRLVEGAQSLAAPTGLGAARRLDPQRLRADPHRGSPILTAPKCSIYTACPPGSASGTRSKLGPPLTAVSTGTPSSARTKHALFSTAGDQPKRSPVGTTSRHKPSARSGAAAPGDTFNAEPDPPCPAQTRDNYLAAPQTHRSLRSSPGRSGSGWRVSALMHEQAGPVGQQPNPPLDELPAPAAGPPAGCAPPTTTSS
jgi:hypothetical protein